MSCPNARPALRLVSLCKRFGAVPVLDHLDLEAAPGVFVVLVGPPGSGRSTLLRVIAGLAPFDGGMVEVAGVDVSRVPAGRRGVGYVAAGCPLFPHLSVADNVGYGLPNGRRQRGQARKRVAELLALVGLRGAAERRPAELRPGERQLAAVAQALAPAPKLMLLDAPQAALAPPLRGEFVGVLKALHKKLGVATVLVSDLAEEALANAERLAVMESGRIVQTGPPQEVYARPVNRAAAAMFGPMNHFDGSLLAQGRVMLGNLRLSCAEHLDDAKPGLRVRIAIRPEDVVVRDLRHDALNVFDATAVACRWHGAYHLVTLMAPPLGDVRLLARVAVTDARALRLEAGMTLRVALPADALRLYPAP